MGKKIREKIFFSWITVPITSILFKEILGKSLKFSIAFGILIGSILTIYFVADYYNLFNLIKEEFESWFK